MKKISITMMLLFSFANLIAEETPNSNKNSTEKVSRIAISRAFGIVLGQNVESEIKDNAVTSSKISEEAAKKIHVRKKNGNYDIYTYPGPDYKYVFKPQNPIIIKDGNKSYELADYWYCVTKRHRVWKIIVALHLGSTKTGLNPQSHIDDIIDDLENKYGKFEFTEDPKYNGEYKTAELTDPRQMDRKITIRKSKDEIIIEYSAEDILKLDNPNQSVNSGNL